MTVSRASPGAFPKTGSRMSLRLPSARTLAFTLAGLVAAWLLFAWLALPRLLKSQAEDFVAERTGHRLAIGRVAFNPLEWQLRIAGLRLDTPDGQPLFAFDELLVDLSARSLTQRTLVFDAVQLDAPQGTVVLHADGGLNWSPFLAALQDTEDEPAAAPPRLVIHRFVLAGGRLDFRDARIGFATRAAPLDLELTDLSTLPDRTGRYQVFARTGVGARVLWHGEATLRPLAASGNVSVDELDLARLAPYLREALPLRQPAGTAAASLDYRAAYADGRFTLVADIPTVTVEGLGFVLGEGGPALAVERIEGRGGRYDLASGRFTLAGLLLSDLRAELPRPGFEPVPLALGALEVLDTAVDLPGRNATVARATLAEGSIQAARDADGRVDLAEALAALAPPAAAAPAENTEPATPPRHYRVDRVALTGFAASLRDQGTTPAAELALQDLALSLDGVSDDLAAPLPVHASFTVASGGRFEAEGEVVPATPSAAVQFKLADLALKAAQPYLTPVARLTVAGGQLSVDGEARYDAQDARFKGGFRVAGLRLLETETGKRFLAWRSLSSRQVAASPTRLDIGELALDGVDTTLIINRDKSVNVARIFNDRSEAAPAAPAAGAQADKLDKAAAFVANVERLAVKNSGMDFADLSLALPFGTRIDKLHGAIEGLSSKPGAPGQVELEGQVDDYGLARAVGQLDLFDPTAFLDLKVVFRNVEMTRLTPYSATFAGRRIDSGKLSLDLEYKIKDRQLAGENQVIMDQLTLGERVESPEAKDLPLDLAIALLQDSEGRIDLGLPVSGSLDDPQFSYGAIIWKAIVNVLTKIVTAPFRALFGSGGEKLEQVAFEAGTAQLTPPEQEKLTRVAAMLNKRPRLALTVRGGYADADRTALQDLALRRAVADQLGRKTEPGADPGPVATGNPKVQAALEDLYAQRLGSAELAALKEGFRTANPGALPQSTAGRMLSRLTGLFRESRPLDEAEVTQLKGADFHAVLFERLRNKEEVADARLQALAGLRGESVAAALTAAGADAARLKLAAPEQVEAKDGEVPVKLGVEVAKAKSP